MTDAQSKQDSVGVDRLVDDFREAVKKTTLAYVTRPQAQYKDKRLLEEAEARDALLNAIAERTRLSTPAEVELRAALDTVARGVQIANNLSGDVPLTSTGLRELREADQALVVLRAALIGANSDGR